MAQENTVRAVERALQILNCFADKKSSYTLMEIARAIELSPSTTLRIIGTLEKEGYIYRDLEASKYYLGSQLAKLAHMAFSDLDVRRIARPHMEQLAEQFGEGAGLYLKRGDKRVCVERIEGIRSLRSVVEIGHSAPLTRGASGRILLAYLPEEQAAAFLGQDAFFSIKDLEQTRKAGYAVSYGEREAGVVSVAAPIYDSSGQVVAALFVTGPETRMNRNVVDNIIPAVIDTSKLISLDMGWDNTVAE